MKSIEMIILDRRGCRARSSPRCYTWEIGECPDESQSRSRVRARRCSGHCARACCSCCPQCADFLGWYRTRRTNALPRAHVRDRASWRLVRALSCACRGPWRLACARSGLPTRATYRLPAAIAIALRAVLALPVVDEALELVVVPSLELVTVLVSSFYVNLFVAELTERTVSHSRVKTAFEVRRETCERLVAKLAPAAEVLRAIAAVKGHIEPFDLQRSVRRQDVSLGEHLRDSQHLFEPMDMSQR